MFKKILVPLDGSKLAEKILPHVEDIAKGLNAQVTLMSASHFAGAAMVSEDTLKQLRADEKTATEKYLNQLADNLKQKGLEINWVYKEGLASTQIIATAKEQNADLIAIASHGGGEFAWNLGSVTEKVMKHTSVPVMVLPVMEKNPPEVKPEWFLGA
ncbi:MAG: universal stress protein [Desulfobacterales bacterium]